MPSVLLPQQHRGSHAHGCPCHAHATEADMKLLEALTAPRLDPGRYKRRDAPLDPLLFVAATMSGPQVTRHHYHHGFSAEDAAELLKQPISPVSSSPTEPKTPRYQSKQAPRKERLAALATRDTNKENEGETRGTTDRMPKPRRNTSTTSAQAPSPQSPVPPKPAPYLLAPEKPLSKPSDALEVQCMVRTRIPTAHGEVFLHLYKNNRDNKEHMAVVVDPAQLSELSSETAAPPIRSKSLDARWSEAETDMDRLVRGAYVGRLSPASTASTASIAALEQFQQKQTARKAVPIPPPLVRIHSECFTGETVGSMRCDCGEQLDEAVRLISQPALVPMSDASVTPMPGRGVVLYLRQEGRGIGLLSKLRAYNLQDLGHDTVTANIMLGHGADERRYGLAGAILRDLGLADGDGVRLLTNNPDKISALASEGVRVSERVEMVPRAWRSDNADSDSGSDVTLAVVPDGDRLGAHTPRGEDLDRYLMTKITRMGHMLHAPTANVD